MTLDLWSAPHIHFARVGDDVVVLDTETDCYHCLLDAAGWMTIHETGRVTVSDVEGASELEEAGFCTAGPPPELRLGFIRPARDLPPPEPPAAMRIAITALRLTLATHTFKGRSLTALIAPIERLGSGDRPAPDLATEIAVARAAFPWAPGEGECLQRAFQLRRLLAARGIAVTWVFGVRTWPFAAHCWLQLDDLVLSDSVERVSRYVPVMAV